MSAPRVIVVVIALLAGVLMLLSLMDGRPTPGPSSAKIGALPDAEPNAFNRPAPLPPSRRPAPADRPAPDIAIELAPASEPAPEAEPQVEPDPQPTHHVRASDPPESDPSSHGLPIRSFRSSHYVIHTTLTRKATQPFGRHMDRVFEQYRQRFQSLGLMSMPPMPLYLFETRAEYEHFISAHGLMPHGTGGLFFATHSLHGLATWTGGRSTDEVFRTLQHEGFHQFAFHAFGPRLPVWLNEGLAQLFEDALVHDGVMHLGHISVLRLTRLREAVNRDALSPLSSLLTMTQPQWSQTLRDRPDEGALLYAQAWSLVHLLVYADNGKHQSALRDYLGRLSDGMSHDVAWSRSLGHLTPSVMHRLWLEHLDQVEPEPLDVARYRMMFLAEAMRFLDEQQQAQVGGLDQPVDLMELSVSDLTEMDALRHALETRGFRLTRHSHGLDLVQSAHESELYQYPRGDGTALPFVLLESARDGLPPRITAPGLTPEPTVRWARDDAGQLAYTITWP